MLKADDKPIEEAVQSSPEPTIESAPSNEAVLGRSNESESVPSNKGGRNFPQEAVARGIANFDDRTLRRKRGNLRCRPYMTSRSFGQLLTPLQPFDSSKLS